MEFKKLVCVLIVDDDRTSNYLTENVIRSLSVSSMINTVTDGMAGLDYIKYQCVDDFEFACPDLIILDINMRLVNGVEFVREYRKLKLAKESLIVILSSQPLRAEQKKELIALGVYNFIIKPLSSAKLLSILDEHFTVSQ